MVRGGSRPIVLGAFFAIVLSACSMFENHAPQAAVTIYGHNDGGNDAWFGLPRSDPLQAVGFGEDDGVACFYGPVGSEIAWFDGPPAQGGRPAKNIGRVAAEDGSAPNVFWVKVAPGGALTTGRGVPAWWVGAAEHC